MKNNKKNKICKSSALILSVLVFFTGTNFVNCETLEQKQQNIQNQINTNNTKITATESEATTYLKQIDELNNQISEYTDDLTSLQGKVDEINKKIEGYENDLQNSSQRFSSAEDLYAVRLRSIYENGIPSIIDILFSSQGISDFFSKMNVYQSVMEYDKSMVDNIDGEKSYIDNIKSDIEVQKVQLDQLKYDVEKSTTALNNAKSQKQSKVNELNASKEKLTAVNSLLTQEAQKVDDQIQAEIKAREEAKKKAQTAASSGTSSSAGSSSGSGTSIVNSNGKFAWPLKGYGKSSITATFPKYPDGTPHTGVDIGVPIGTPVYAAAAGEVIKSKYYIQSDRGGSYADGYGNYVMIDHGDYYTLYGHLKYKQVVTVGQTVSQGQLIAYTASTGNSTGPHLHFEVRKGTKAVNPMQFFN